MSSDHEKKIAWKLSKEFGCAYGAALQRVRVAKNVEAAEKLKASSGKRFADCLEQVVREDMKAWRERT